MYILTLKIAHLEIYEMRQNDWEHGNLSSALESFF